MVFVINIIVENLACFADASPSLTGAAERVVDTEQQIHIGVSICNISCFSNVHNLQRRVRRRLKPQQPRVWVFF